DSIRKLIDTGDQASAEKLAQSEFMGLKGPTEDQESWFAEVAQERKKEQGPYSFAYKDETWGEIEVPSYEGWETVGHEGLNGAVWFRKEFTLTKEELEEAWTLDLNKVRQQDYTYLNGILIGETADENQARSYAIAKQNLRVGKNILAVQVINVVGKGGIAGYKNTAEPI